MKNVSIVLPTRDRPSFLRDALESLTRQTSTDFDVFVSDNSSSDSSRRICEKFADLLNLRYERTSRNLSHVENWNHAISKAHGLFVAVMIDKTAWNRRVVEVILRTSTQSPDADVISWGHDYLVPIDSLEESGILMPRLVKRMSPKPVSLIDALIARRDFKIPRSLQDAHTYTLGKICFGAYRSDLISRITQRHGQVFHPISPDYSSMTLASHNAKCAIQMGSPLQVSRISETSNGTRSAASPSYAFQYLKSVDPNLSTLPKLPVPGLYQSIENTVAFDLTQFDSMYPLPAANLANLRKRVVAEVRLSGQSLCLESVPGDLVEELKRDMAKTHLSSQIFLQLFVQMRKRLFASELMRSTARVSPKYRTKQCLKVKEALDSQDLANTSWYEVNFPGLTS